MLSIEQPLIFLTCLHKGQIKHISHPLPAEKVTDTLNQSLACDNMPHLDRVPTYSALYMMGFGKPTLFFGLGLNFALQTGPTDPIADGTLRRLDSRRSSSTGRDHNSATRVFSRALMHRRRSPERLIYYARCPWQVSTSHWTTETALESEPYARKHSCSAQIDQSHLIHAITGSPRLCSSISKHYPKSCATAHRGIIPVRRVRDSPMREAFLSSPPDVYWAACVINEALFLQFSRR